MTRRHDGPTVPPSSAPLRPVMLLVAVAAAGAFALGFAADANAARVSGTVKNARGMTLIALAPDGSAVSRRLSRGGQFNVRLPRGRGTTLHLVKASGAYHGPLVLARAKRRAYTALSGRAAKLGAFRLRRGYAVARGRIGTRVIYRRAIAQADRRGRPLGAGRLGLVRSRGVRRARIDGGAAASAGADVDRDGMVGPFDVDDDGDAILDGVDSGGASTSAGLGSYLILDFPRTANANAEGFAAIDAMLAGGTGFFMDVRLHTEAIPGVVGSVNVDCFELSYCRPGSGTATIVNDDSGLGFPPDYPRGARWVTYDPDADGLPNLARRTDRPHFSVSIEPRTTRDQINPGDTFAFKLTGEGTPPSAVGTLDYLFLSAPAIQSYDVGAGPRTMSYPPNADSPGTMQNPIRLTSDTLALALWRPQREGIPNAESAPLVDMGRLHYAVSASGPGVDPPAWCGNDLSATSPTLQPIPGASVEQNQGAALQDTADDAPASADRTIGFTVNLGECMRRRGSDPDGPVAIGVAAADRRGASAAQRLYVCLPGRCGGSGG